ncbi:MAG TPA: SDR family oxidoreductase [Euzebya sp.]|nr:SDR family oxidoreductase [Euzebya sp.]
MDLGLQDKVAAVAGGTSGLGLATARALRAEGATVAVCGRDGQRVAAAAAEGLDATALDVTDAVAAADWLDGIAGRYGALHVLLANAGGPPAGTATAFGIAAYRAAVEVNLLSQIALVQAALPHLQAAGWGRILFVTSKTVRQPMPGLALSNTARAGIVGYAKSLVADLGQQDRAAGRTGTITVNVLAPGSTRTGRLESLAGDDIEAGLAAMAADIPLGRVGTPEEFAAATTFLASDAASFISGVVLPVDGGEIQGM